MEKANPHLMWLHTESLAEMLDAATWLETTQELRNSGWQVTLVNRGVGQQKIRGVEVTGISRPTIYFLGQMLYHLQFMLLLAKNWKNTDIVLFHQMSALWLMPIKLLRVLLRRSAPLFAMDTRTLHMLKNTDKESLRHRVRGWYYHFAQHFATWWVDGQLAITPRMAETLTIPQPQLWGVWPSGVDNDHFNKASPARQWPAENDPIVIVYIGSLAAGRGLLEFSHAVVKANQLGFKFRFLMVGSGDIQDELIKRAAQSGGILRVEPPLPHEQVVNVLARGHLGVLPFPDEEKFRVSSPIKLFEYMASGMPVLATRIVCHTDVVANGEYVFWAEEACEEAFLNTLRSIWSHKQLLPQMGKAAMEASTDWSWRASGQKLKQALEHGLTRQLRVLTVTNTYPTPDYPARTPCVKEQMEALQKQGIEIDLLHINVDTGKLNYLKAAWQIFRLNFLPRRYDVVHAHYGHSALLARLQFKYPIVATFHGSDLLGGKNSTLHRLDGLIGRTAARLVNKTIVMSEEMSRVISQSTIIPFGVNTAIFKPIHPQQAREALGFKENEKYVLFPWNPNRPEKNFILAQQAIALLKKKYQVHLLPVANKSREEIACYMNACDAMVLVSHHEGSPMAIREAMACNLPIVSVNVGDVADIIAGIENCYLAERSHEDIAKKLSLIFESGKRSNGTTKISAFDVTQGANQVRAVYEQL